MSYRAYLEKFLRSTSMFRYHTVQKANNKGAWVRRLVCTFVVRKPPKTGFLTPFTKHLYMYLITNSYAGADWRMFGERIGIPSETMYQWKRWKLDYPMFYVLQSWSQSPGATVRLLHRHLVSPQMRNTLLAKRLSDFYCVD